MIRLKFGFPRHQPQSTNSDRGSTAWRAVPVPSSAGSGHESDGMFSPRRLTAFGWRDRGGVVPRVGSANCVAARPVDLIEAHFKAAHAASFILSIATPELCAPWTFIRRLARSRVNDEHRSHHANDDKNPHFILLCFEVCSTRDIRRRQYVLTPCNHHLRSSVRNRLTKKRLPASAPCSLRGPFTHKRWHLTAITADLERPRGTLPLRRLGVLGRLDRTGLVARIGRADGVAARPVDLAYAHFETAHAAILVRTIAAAPRCRAPWPFIICLARPRMNGQQRR